MKVNERVHFHVCNFVTKNICLWLLYLGNSSLSDYHLVPTLEQNLGEHKFKHDHVVETVVMWWLIT
jgi:hypothetical protein